MGLMKLHGSFLVGKFQRSCLVVFVVFVFVTVVAVLLVVLKEEKVKTEDRLLL